MKLRRTLAILMSCLLAVSVFSVPASAVGRFTDVPDNAYYADAVEWAVENDITFGTGANTFRPDAYCTRAQALTFIWKALGSPSSKYQYENFADVAPNDYFYDAVLWATENHITSGTSNTAFSPNQTVTRAQAMTFLYKAANAYWGETITNPFGDVRVSDYYYRAVLWAVGQNITSGTSATQFSPNAYCTRGQMMVFLYKYFVGDSANPNVPDYANAYKRQLQAHPLSTMHSYTNAEGEIVTYFTDTEYTLYDIDKDETPELIIKEDSVDYYIYSFDGRWVKSLGNFSWLYADPIYAYGDAGIIVHDGGFGNLHFEQVYLYTIQNGKLENSEMLLDTETVSYDELDEYLSGFEPIDDFHLIDDFSLLS